MSVTMINTTNDQIDDLRSAFEAYLQDLLFDSEQLKAAPPLNFAMQYMVEGAGKRIRPLVVLAICRSLERVDAQPRDSALAFATAIELLHNASLIHDDLPALDDDRMRRGRPTCHIQFGEATALLAGDLIVPFALQLVAERAGETPSMRLHCVTLLAQAYRELCQGQQLDILPAAQRGDLITIARLKTGALFSAAFAGAGVISGVSPESIERLARIGSNAGICFQIGNDHLDRFGSERDQGRSAGSDLRNDKVTFFTAAGAQSGGDPRAVIRDARAKIESEMSALKAALQNEQRGTDGIEAALGLVFGASEITKIAI